MSRGPRRDSAEDAEEGARGPGSDRLVPRVRGCEQVALWGTLRPRGAIQFGTKCVNRENAHLFDQKQNNIQDWCKIEGIANWNTPNASNLHKSRHVIVFGIE